MNLVARVRHVLARRPWLYWSAVVILAAAGALVVADAAAGVDAARRSWGDDRQVVVATADVAAGEPLRTRVETVRRPAPMVPASAVEAVPAGAVARQHVATGEIVVAGDVAAVAGPRAFIPDGWLALAVAEAVPSGAAVGDRVAASSGGGMLAADAVVVGRPDGAVLVAVPAGDAPAVADAAAAGTLVLLLAP